MELESKIEGLLFYKGEDMTISKIVELLKVETEEVNQAILKLEQTLEGRGLTLIKKDNSICLGISKELSPIIESIRKEELTKDLSKASIETLSIIMYKNGVSRSEIDYIRGVNSSFIIRNLLVRGLIEKIIDEKDSRRNIYRPSFDTLSYMGVTSIENLPNYKNIRKDIDNVINQKENHD